MLVRCLQTMLSVKMQERLEGATRKFKKGGRIWELLKEREKGRSGKEERGGREKPPRGNIYVWCGWKKEILNN